MKSKPKPQTRTKRQQYEDDLRADGECLNENCKCTFCPEHSEVDIWAGRETFRSAGPSWLWGHF